MPPRPARSSGIASSVPIAVTGYQSPSGLVNLLTPTSAVVMGGTTLSRIPYDRFLRSMVPFFGIAFVLSRAFVVVGTAFS